MKVAFIGIKGLPARAGVDRVVESIVTRMPILGVEPFVYCDPKFTNPDFSIKGVNLVRTPSIRGKHLGATTLLFLEAAHAVLFENYDLIHLHNIESSYILPILRLKYPVISTGHGFAYQRAKWNPFAKFILRMMDPLFIKLSNIATVVSAKDAFELESRFGFKPKYIPNGVDSGSTPDLRSARTILNKHGVQPGKYFIFVAGRIEPTKGAHVALGAVNQMDSITPLLIVGDDQQLPHYGIELHELASSKIHFQSLVKDQNTLFGLMKSAKCLIFPSSVEAMSMVLLEAASLGVPIVCSNIAENKAVMEQGALYFSPGDVNELIDKLLLVEQQPDNMIEMSRRVQKRILKQFSWDTIVKQYFELYEEVYQSYSINE